MGSDPRPTPVTLAVWRGGDGNVSEFDNYDDAVTAAAVATPFGSPDYCLAVIRDELGIMVAAMDSKGHDWFVGGDAPAASVVGWATSAPQFGPVVVA